MRRSRGSDRTRPSGSGASEVCRCPPATWGTSPRIPSTATSAAPGSEPAPPQAPLLPSPTPPAPRRAPSSVLPVGRPPHAPYPHPSRSGPAQRATAPRPAGSARCAAWTRCYPRRHPATTSSPGTPHRLSPARHPRQASLLRRANCRGAGPRLADPRLERTRPAMPVPPSRPAPRPPPALPSPPGLPTGSSWPDRDKPSPGTPDPVIWPTQPGRVGTTTLVPDPASPHR
jgi:hypothetical protein